VGGSPRLRNNNTIPRWKTRRIGFSKESQDGKMVEEDFKALSLFCGDERLLKVKSTRLGRKR
jgi:hypothetical protein